MRLSPRRLHFVLAAVGILGVAWLLATWDGWSTPRPPWQWEVGPAEVPAAVPLADAPELPGRVVARFQLEPRLTAWAWSRFRYSPDHGISIWTDDGDREIGMHHLGFACHLFGSDGHGVYYATVNARVGAVDGTGRRRWETVQDQPPTAISVHPHDGVIVGDKSGGVTWYTASGERRWHRGISSNPIIGLFQVADEILALSSDGRVHWLEADGSSPWNGTGLPGGARVVTSGAGVPVTTDAEGQTWLLRFDPTAGEQWRAKQYDHREVWWWSAWVICLGMIAFPWVRWRSTIEAVWRARVAYLMLLPCFALLAAFEYGPALAAMRDSLFARQLTGSAEFVGLENFKNIANDPYFWTGLRNLGLITLTGVLKLAVPLLAAELVFWLSKESWRQLYRTLFLLPGVVPGLVTILLWKMIYDPSIGLANQLLATVGLETWQRAWLADPSTALWAVITAGFPWIGITAFLVLLGGLLKIPSSVFESAGLDGADAWRRFRLIDLPLLRPQLRLLLILTVIGCVQEFASVLVMTRGGPGIATYTPALHLFLETTEGGNVGYASAIGIVLFVLAMMASGVISRTFHRLDA